MNIKKINKEFQAPGKLPRLEYSTFLCRQKCVQRFQYHNVSFIGKTPNFTEINREVAHIFCRVNEETT